MSPAFVWTVVTAPELSLSKPVTSTPSTICAPAARALSARPCIDSLLNAKPPACSCRQTVRPWARQSGYSPRHVRRDLGLAGDELGRVADALLALEDRDEVGLLLGRPEGDVARAVVVNASGSDSQISTQAAMSSCIAGWK